MRHEPCKPGHPTPRRLLAMVWVLLGLWIGTQWLAEQHWHGADDPVEFSCELCHLGHSPAVPAALPQVLALLSPPAGFPPAAPRTCAASNWSIFSIRAPPCA